MSQDLTRKQNLRKLARNNYKEMAQSSSYEIKRTKPASKQTSSLKGKPAKCQFPSFSKRLTPEKPSIRVSFKSSKDSSTSASDRIENSSPVKDSYKKAENCSENNVGKQFNGKDYSALGPTFKPMIRLEKISFEKYCNPAQNLNYIETNQSNINTELQDYRENGAVPFKEAPGKLLKNSMPKKKLQVKSLDSSSSKNISNTKKNRLNSSAEIDTENNMNNDNSSKLRSGNADDLKGDQNLVQNDTQQIEARLAELDSLNRPESDNKVSILVPLPMNKSSEKGNVKNRKSILKDSSGERPKKIVMFFDDGKKNENLPDVNGHTSSPKKSLKKQPLQEKSNKAHFTSKGSVKSSNENIQLKNKSKVEGSQENNMPQIELLQNESQIKHKSQKCPKAKSPRILESDSMNSEFDDSELKGVLKKSSTTPKKKKNKNLKVDENKMLLMQSPADSSIIDSEENFTSPSPAKKAKSPHKRVKPKKATENEKSMKTEKKLSESDLELKSNEDDPVYSTIDSVIAQFSTLTSEELMKIQLLSHSSKKKRQKKKKEKPDLEMNGDTLDEPTDHSAVEPTDESIVEPTDESIVETPGEKKKKKKHGKSQKKLIKSPKKKMRRESPIKSPKKKMRRKSPTAEKAPSALEGSLMDMPLIDLDTTTDLTKNYERVTAAADGHTQELDRSLTETKGKKARRKKEVVVDDTPYKKKRGRKRAKKGDVKSAPPGDEPVSPKKARKKNQRRTGRRFSVTGNWYIASGYLNDIISLLEDFDSTDSWRFRDFARCWHNKAFSLVFRGRQTFKELLEFSEEIALLTKRFLGPPHGTKRRIGALYTLYGLYNKFPLGKLHFFSLRFELQEYKDLLELVHPFRSSLENPDPAYIFRKLELEGAIRHCATAFEPCYDFHNEEREYVELEYGKQRLAKSSAVSIAIPKAQLHTDSDLLQHYHGLKSRLAGNDEKNPERALALVSQDFFETISSNLTQLRKDTLVELDMIDENVKLGMDKGLDTDGDEDQTFGVPSGRGSPDAEPMDLMQSVNQELIDAVNKSAIGQRTQKSIEHNMITKDAQIKDFMQPPTAEDLNRPLRLQNKYGKSKPTLSEGWTKNLDEFATNPLSEVDDVVSEPLPEREGRTMVQLTLDSEPPEYSELKDVLLPQPIPQKRRRGRKRPAALLKAASYTNSRSRKACSTGPTIVKSLEDDEQSLPYESKVEFTIFPPKSAGGSTSAVKVSIKPVDNLTSGNVSSTNPSAKPDSSIPPKIKQSGDTALIMVRMTCEGIRKTVTLKVKVTPEQFLEMKDDAVRYEKFKAKLRPLIKATQKGENKRKEWMIESIDLHQDVQQQENVTSELPVKTEKAEETTRIKVTTEHPVPLQQSQKVIPLKQRFECLKYDDDEDENDELDDDDYDDEFPQPKTKTEEQLDGDYNPPQEDEVEEDPLEFEDEGVDEESDWEPDEKVSYWRKRKKRRNWYGEWDEERGPRDSDQLLQVRNNAKITMVARTVGGVVRYFPMVQTQEQAASKKNVPEEATKKEGDSEQLIIPDQNEGAMYTWNDFSSHVSPPFKKRRRSEDPYTYFYTPKLRKVIRHHQEQTQEEKQTMQSPKRLHLTRPPATAPRTRASAESGRQEDAPSLIPQILPRKRGRGKRGRPRKLPDTDSKPTPVSPTKTPVEVIKKEPPSVLEEIAGDWDEEGSDLQSVRGDKETHLEENKDENDDLIEENKDENDDLIEENKDENDDLTNANSSAEDGSIHSFEEVEEDEGHLTLADDSDEGDLVDVEVSDEEDNPESAQHESSPAQVPVSAENEQEMINVNNSFSEVTEILPNIPLSNANIYEDGIQVIPVQYDQDFIPMGISSASSIAHEDYNILTSTADINSQQPLITSPLPNVANAATEVLNVALNQDGEKHLLYYKMVASNGNDIFIPVSSLPEIGGNNIEILSFDRADVKPFTSPTKSDLGLTSTGQLDYSPTSANNFTLNTRTDDSQKFIDSFPNEASLEDTALRPHEYSQYGIQTSTSSPLNNLITPELHQSSFNTLTVSRANELSTFDSFKVEAEITPDTIQAFNTITEPGSTTSHISNTIQASTQPGSSTCHISNTPTQQFEFQRYPQPLNQFASTPKYITTPKSENSFQEKPLCPKPLPSYLTKTSKSGGSPKPACSFLFSPKLSAMSRMNSVVGKASGKVPSSEKPKVKFLFKGLFKSSKR